MSQPKEALMAGERGDCAAGTAQNRLCRVGIRT